MSRRNETKPARRATERTYLDALAAACSPEAWGEIVVKAVEDAKAGDAKSREWLASYLVGRPENAATTLHKIAVEEMAGSDPLAHDADMERLFSI